MQQQDHKKLLRDMLLGAALRPEDMVRSCRAILGSLPIILPALLEGKGKKIEIKYGHVLGATDGKTIHLMDLPIPDSATDVDTFVLMLSLAYGLIHHEVGHVNYSDFDVLKEVGPDALLQNVFGIIEDIREENVHIASVPSARKYLDALNHAMFITGHNYELSLLDSPLSVFTGYLSYRGTYEYRGQASLQFAAEGADAVARQKFPPTLFEGLDRLLPRIPTLTNTADALALSRDICELLRDESEQSSSNPSQEAEQGSDGEGEGSAPSDNVDADGNDAPGDPGADGGLGTTEPETVQQHADNLKAILDATEADAVYGDKGSKISAALRDIADQIDPDDSTGAIRLTGEDVTSNITTTSDEVELGAGHDLLAGLAVTTDLRRRLITKLQAMTDAETTIRTRGRRLSGRHLSRIPVGDGRVFSHRVPGVAIDTTVVFAQDISPSMKGEQLEISCQALFASVSVLETIEGVSCGAVAFPGNYTVKPLKLQGRKNPESFQLECARGGTPLDRGIVLARRMLDQAPRSRRIMIVLTDGEPDNRAEARLAIESAERAGIEVFGLGICTDAGKSLFTHWQSITSVADLPTTLMELLQSRVLRAA